MRHAHLLPGAVLIVLGLSLFILSIIGSYNSAELCSTQPSFSNCHVGGVIVVVYFLRGLFLLMSIAGVVLTATAVTQERHIGDKPTAALVLSMIGGSFVISGGASQLSPMLARGIVGVVMGIIMVIGGFMMYSKPTTVKLWGLIVLILSIGSWVTAIGGFGIGFLLGLIGGILGLTFQPLRLSTH